MSAATGPFVSEHAKLRLLQRAGIDVGSVLDAWYTASPVHIDYREYDLAKYHDKLGVILLERDGVITTVLRATWERFTEGDE